jgi:V/A-type H+-transporting ATPase subunit B
MTREDHRAVEQGLYAAYAEGRDLHGLVAIVGEDALSERDRKFLKFADIFEDRFIRQGREEDRSFEYTLDLGWELLSYLPGDALTRIDRTTLEKYHPAYRKKSSAKKVEK